MTYQIYSHQQLQQKSIARLKQIYSEIGCTLEVSDKRCKDSWISAIANYQSTQVQKVDEQANAQAELENFIADQAEAVAPEELRTVEISFYDHEYYADDKLIASITHDDNDFVTQRWVVMVDGAETFRANSWARCHRFIQWHHQDSTLHESLPTQIETPCTTDNRTMSHIFSECQKYGFEILDDSIYNNGMKLGQVGYTNGNWWVIRGASGQQQYSDSVFDAVRSLAEIQSSSIAVLLSDEELLDLPFDKLTEADWQRLRTYELEQELVTA